MSKGKQGPARAKTRAKKPKGRLEPGPKSRLYSQGKKEGKIRLEPGQRAPGACDSCFYTPWLLPKSACYRRPLPQSNLPLQSIGGDFSPPDWRTSLEDTVSSVFPCCSHMRHKIVAGPDKMGIFYCLQPISCFECSHL